MLGGCIYYYILEQEEEGHGYTRLAIRNKWSAKALMDQTSYKWMLAAQTAWLSMTCTSLSKFLTALYLFDPSIPDQARRTSSRPDASLVTPCPANPNRPPTPSSHRVLRSTRRNEVVRSNTTPARQLHELNIQNRHIHLIEIKYCKDTRLGAHLEASQQQHIELRKQLQSAEIILHTILLGVRETIYTAHTLDQLKKLGIDPQRFMQEACQLEQEQGKGNKGKVSIQEAACRKEGCPN
eukprot:1160994-Pelagomonas_calceolata.AAC.7